MLKKLVRIFRIPLPMRISMMTRVFLMVLNFLTTLLVARLYGSVATGQIALIASMLVFTSVVSLGGFQMMALRNFAGTPSNLKTLFTSYLFRVVIGALIVGFSLYLAVIPMLVDRFENRLGNDLVNLFPFIAAANTLRVFLYETMRSREEIIAYSLLLLLGPINLLLLALIAPVAFPGMNLSWIVVISELVGMLVVIPLLMFKGSGIGLTKIRITDLKVKSRQYYVSSLSVMAQTQDILLIGLIVPSDQLGVYAVATRFASIVALPRTMAGISYAPEVARIFRDQGKEAALMHTRKTTRNIMPMTLVLAIVILPVGFFVLDLLGAEFRAGYPVLILLAATHLLLAFIGHSGLLLMMAGHGRFQMSDFLLSASVMIVLLIMLVPSLGILGGGIAMLAAALARAIFGTIAIQQVFGKGITALHVFGRLDQTSESLRVVNSKSRTD